MSAGTVTASLTNEAGITVAVTITVPPEQGHRFPPQLSVAADHARAGLVAVAASQEVPF